jgi:hypothetical protein
MSVMNISFPIDRNLWQILISKDLPNMSQYPIRVIGMPHALLCFRTYQFLFPRSYSLHYDADSQSHLVRYFTRSSFESCVLVGRNASCAGISVLLLSRKDKHGDEDH